MLRKNVVFFLKKNNDKNWSSRLIKLIPADKRTIKKDMHRNFDGSLRKQRSIKQCRYKERTIEN